MYGLLYIGEKEIIAYEGTSRLSNINAHAIVYMLNVTYLRYQTTYLGYLG